MGLFYTILSSFVQCFPYEKFLWISELNIKIAEKWSKDWPSALLTSHLFPSLACFPCQILLCRQAMWLRFWPIECKGPSKCEPNPAPSSKLSVIPSLQAGCKLWRTLAPKQWWSLGEWAWTSERLHGTKPPPTLCWWTCSRLMWLRDKPLSCFKKKNIYIYIYIYIYTALNCH